MLKIVDYAITKNGVLVLAENENEFIAGAVYDFENDQEVSFYDICGKRSMHKGSWTMLEVKTRFYEMEQELKNANGMIWG